MRIVQGDPADQATTQAYYEVVQAAAEADDPLGPPWSLTRLRGWLRYQSEPAEVWAAVDEATGDTQGWYFLILPARENTDRAMLHFTVRPAARRRGAGTALLRHAAGRSAKAGRSVLAGGAFEGSPGAAFAVAAGATPGLVEARRMQVLSKLPAGTAGRLRERAAAAATGYSLVSWAGRVPDEYLATYAAVSNAMEDAPHDEGEEPEVWDADRAREHADLRERQGRRIYTVAARHDATGELAAVTEVEADPDNPGWGHQLFTAVTRTHRGHRLGLLVKTAMLEQLAQAEPGMDRIVTGNAAVNQHMIAINEELGYELLSPAGQSFELPVATALG
jgi:RimJ/RimL family protein N-acetyltransferase